MLSRLVLNFWAQKISFRRRSCGIKPRIHSLSVSVSLSLSRLYIPGYEAKVGFELLIFFYIPSAGITNASLFVQLLYSYLSRDQGCDLCLCLSKLVSFAVGFSWGVDNNQIQDS